jgi:TctA family transporter
MDIELIGGISAVLIIVGLIQALKNFGLDTKMAPVVAIILGLATSFGLSYYRETKAFEAVVLGLAVGLSAVGLYSGTKNTVEKFRSED